MLDTSIAREKTRLQKSALRNREIPFKIDENSL